MDAHKRNSRWSRAPVINVAGEPSVARLSNNDIEIFRLLARYRYLSITDIHAFVGGNFKHLNQRLSLLSREPNLFLKRPPQQRQNAMANCAPLIYELDRKARALLSEHGLPGALRQASSNFVHELMACRIMASIELGIRLDGHARLIEWSEICAKLPHETRGLASPHSIRVWMESDKPSTARSDSLPFGIERGAPDQKTYIFFPGIEADCRTEPIHASNLDRSSIHMKFVTYAKIAERRIYHSHYGFPNFFVPIVTTTRARMSSMIMHLRQLIDARQINAPEAAIFLFKTFPNHTSAEARQPLNGKMFTEPWQRAAFNPFSMK